MLIDATTGEQEPIRERAQRYLDDPSLVRNIVADGCERARKFHRGNDAATCAQAMGPTHS